MSGPGQGDRDERGFGDSDDDVDRFTGSFAKNEGTGDGVIREVVTLVL